MKYIKRLNVKFGDIQIKQHSRVKYLGCLLDEAMSGEAMTLKVVNKVNSNVKFLYRKGTFLTPALKYQLCDASMQSHFDYACSTWYLNSTNKLKHGVETTQNKCMCFCLQSDKLKHIISYEEFENV